MTLPPMFTSAPTSISSFTGDYRWLSNFHPCRIEDGGVEFGSVEAAYQSNKADNLDDFLLFADLTPGQAKRLGREIKIRSDWDDIKVMVMHRLLIEKFWHHVNLRELLLNTGDLELIEGNNWGDTFWGVCNGVGENMLGKLLMNVRDTIELYNWERKS